MDTNTMDKKKQYKKYTVGIVRHEGYDGEPEKTRIVKTFTTYAKSEAQAINNIRFRCGGNKSLAYIDGSGHYLEDEYEIVQEGEVGYMQFC